MFKSLFNYLAQADSLREQRLNEILQVYREESRSVAMIDSLEKDLQPRLQILPVLRARQELTLTLEAAILSLRGWLLAFGVVTLILLSLSVGLKYQKQGALGLEEGLTYNADPAQRDSLLVSDEIDYGH